MNNKKENLDFSDDFEDELDEHNHHEDMDIIYLNLEDGTDIECGIIGVFEVEDKDYMALWAIEEDEVLLFAYEELEDEFELIPIEDPDEFDLVSQAYYALFSEDDYDEYDEYDDYDEED